MEADNNGPGEEEGDGMAGWVTCPSALCDPKLNSITCHALQERSQIITKKRTMIVAKKVATRW